MSKALLTFSNLSPLELHVGQEIARIAKCVHGSDFDVSCCSSYQLKEHLHQGLTESICILLCSCDFFHILGDKSIVYNSKLVVTIQNL